MEFSKGVLRPDLWGNLPGTKGWPEWVPASSSCSLLPRCLSRWPSHGESRPLHQPLSQASTWSPPGPPRQAPHLAPCPADLSSRSSLSPPGATKVCVEELFIVCTAKSSPMKLTALKGEVEAFSVGPQVLSDLAPATAFSPILPNYSFPGILCSKAI